MDLHNLAPQLGSSCNNNNNKNYNNNNNVITMIMIITILIIVESGLVWLDLSDSGVFWERKNWRLGSLEPGWLEWKGSCCTSFLGISSKNIGGLEGSCSAGDQEKYLQVKLNLKRNNTGHCIKHKLLTKYFISTRCFCK